MEEELVEFVEFATWSLGSKWAIFLELICLALSAFGLRYYLQTKRVQNERPSRRTLVYFAVLNLIPILALIPTILDLMWVDRLPFFLWSALSAMLSCVLLLSDLGGADEVRSATSYRLRQLLFFVISVFAAFLAMEVSFNPLLPSAPLPILGEILIITLLFFALLLLGGGYGHFIAISELLFFLIGTAEYFVENFRSQGIIVSDLFALNTALSVASSYEFRIGYTLLLGSAAAMVGIAASALLKPHKQADEHAQQARPFPSIASGAACLVLLLALIMNLDFAKVFQVKLRYWQPSESYADQGFLISFIHGLKQLRIEVPRNYNRETALDAQMRLANELRASEDSVQQAREEQFSELRPNVFVVMNESFNDLSELDELGTGYPGPVYFKELQAESLLAGTIYVSVYGAGTDITEFEFLTGVSYASILAGKDPYTMYKLEAISSLAKDLNALGYRSIAIHAHPRRNWNRENVYPNLGFAEFISDDSLQGYDAFVGEEVAKIKVHGRVSDLYAYEMALDMIEESDEPLFIFNVTIQNHGGYDYGHIPEQYLVDYAPDGLNGYHSTRLNEYLSCIEASDHDLRILIERLQEMDEPCILIFFGDHQPSVMSKSNDLLMTDEDEMTHQLRAYSSKYLVWANYDVAAAPESVEWLDTSINYLGIHAMHTLGMPLNDFEASQEMLRSSSISAVNTIAYQGADGTWYEADDEGAFAESYQELCDINYLNFGELV